MQYKLWDRTSNINGVAPSHFLKQPTFKNYTGDIILIYADNGKVLQVERKDILAKVYGIDINLGLDAFMLTFFDRLEEQSKQTEEVGE